MTSEGQIDVGQHRCQLVAVEIGELEARLAELPDDREVVAYCRGPYCVMAVDAVTLLRKRGLRAHRLEQGVTEWRARGWRVAHERERAEARP